MPRIKLTPKRRVLVVEDNLDAVHSMALLIKMMGHECQSAINGFTALDFARKFRPDGILREQPRASCDFCRPYGVAAP